MRVFLAIVCAGTMMTGCSTTHLPTSAFPVYSIPNETPQRVYGGHLGKSKVSYRGVMTSPCTMNGTLRSCVE